MSIGVDQLCYVRSLQEITVSSSYNSRSEVLDGMDRDEFRALIGQLNWVSTQTRPDIAFEVCQLNSSFNDATVTDLLRANKVVRMLKSENVIIRFPRLSDLSECYVERHSDAAFGNLMDGGSQGGYVIFLVDSDNR